MRWAEKKRIEFIGAVLKSRGFINRRDIMQEFEVSMPQAAVDLRTFRRLYPKSLVYNSSLKRYEATSRARSAHQHNRSTTS